jgi:tRNA-Thr(GGU) m(6)t(6)A37 methyltransferase TsaA
MIFIEKIELKPVGFVSTGIADGEFRKRDRVSRIVLQEDLGEALDGIEDFSHLFVVFWMHKIPLKQRGKLKVHPRGRNDLPLLGAFATRTPYRPNPIGLTLVELADVHGNVLTVRGLDALDKTPVLDIKPFDYWDMVQNARVPKWWRKLEKERARSQTDR